MFLTPDTYSGVLLRRSRGGTTLFIWALALVPIGVPLSGPDKSPSVPGEVRLCLASIEAAGTDTVPAPSAVDLSGSLGFFGAAR
jgi:hypothetical protein